MCSLGDFFGKQVITSHPCCTELCVIKSLKSGEVCTPSELSGSLQKFRSGPLVDWVNCAFGQRSALTDFPGTCLQGLLERLSPDIWTQQQKATVRACINASSTVRHDTVLV